VGRPVTVLVCALGGEGGGVLAEWLYAAAVRAGHRAQATSIPGVAQRTGATTYYLEIDPLPVAGAGARPPVFSLNPVPGAIDLLVSSELLEAARQAGLGMANAERTIVIASTARALTVAEKMQLGDGRADDAALRAVVERHARAAYLLDFGALAREAGTAVSAVLAGAIAAGGVLPFGREAVEETIRAHGVGVDASLRGFALAFDAVRRQRMQGAQADDAAMRRADPAPRAPPARPRPADVRALARRRVVEYQDEAYGRLFDERLARIDAAERAADPQARAHGALADEAARWLALWMAFDDIVRVAALKLAESRMRRVRGEVGARDDEVVLVHDHFKPGVPEIAGLLPPRLAQLITAWDSRRVAGGRAPWSWPLKLPAHAVAGALALRLLAGMKGRRRKGSRFAHEQQLIERWLAAVEAGAREDWTLGHELAQCGRLVKGYGATNERGKATLLHIVDHLACTGHPPEARAQAVHAARAAALADDTGRALDQALAAHGAPARPVREQPVRWFRRRPAQQ
jgi:indolepyruvate ferredoxin oxidoreductase beta subunit